MPAVVTLSDDVFAEQAEVLFPSHLQRCEISLAKRIIIAIEPANQVSGDGVRVEGMSGEL